MELNSEAIDALTPVFFEMIDRVVPKGELLEGLKMTPDKNVKS